MQFNHTAISSAVSEVQTNADPKAIYKWSLEFKVLEEGALDTEDEDICISPREKEGFFSPIFLPNIDFIGDYEKTIGYHVSVACMVSAGLWVHVLEPNRNHLRVYLTRARVTGLEGDVDMQDTPVVFVYKPIFKEDGASKKSVGEVKKISRKELDMRGMLDLQIDLLPYALEAVQAAPVGGIWRNTTAMDVLRSNYIGVCSQFELEGEKLIEHYQIAKDYNTQKLGFIDIKGPTPLMDLHKVLQDNYHGIWPTGISRFLKDKTWFIFPPYDLKRITKERRTLSIFIAPQKEAGSSPRSYFIDGDTLKIVCTGDINVKDTTQENFLKHGDGLRYASASSVLEGQWLTLKDGKAVASRAANYNELRIKADSYTDHRMQEASRNFSDNTMANLSTLAGRKGFVVSLTWNYADHTLIDPGMPVRIFYQDASELKTLVGNVMFQHAAIQTTQQGISQGNYITTSALMIFCTPEEELS